MEIFLFIAAAVTAYLVSGWNPAITFSKLIYKKDIRTCGSKNPGFTNFKRTFGNKWAWFVLALDLSKAAVVVVIYAILFGNHMGMYQFGAAYTAVFAVLGHAFPVWYGFKGGKGFLVSLSSVWVIDWRVGLIATVIMIVLLLTTKYMSLSTVVAMLCCPVMLAIFGSDIKVVLIVTAIVLFMAIRHKENFKRLLKGTESRFELRKKK
ncbi:MAG: glycerol-3-phosphate acyltransferase [Ruminococcaceae bacterium]|nr:glycerol-3-phosphate acyltransferase [Oscillospiraceae bacterium]